MPPKIGYFRHESYFGHKKSLEEGPISQTLWKKIVKSAVFEVEKTLRNGSRFAKISGKKKHAVYSAVFWVRKILRYGLEG